MENGKIKDSQLTASSMWMGIATFGPQRARLNNRKWPQGWSAAIRDHKPWLKVSLDAEHVITAVATQGYGNAIFNEWVENYYVSWSDKNARDVVYEENGKVKVSIGTMAFLLVIDPEFMMTQFQPGALFITALLLPLSSMLKRVYSFLIAIFSSLYSNDDRFGPGSAARLVKSLYRISDQNRGFSVLYF